MTILRKILRYIMPAVLMALLAVSCTEQNDEYLVTTIIVKGKVVDAADDAPLSGIRVAVTEYSSDDSSKSNALSTTVLVTNYDGSYSFVTVNEEAEPIGKSFYEFRVEDPEKVYITNVRDLYMSSSNSYYSSSSRSYRVSDNDFSLSR